MVDYKDAKDIARLKFLARLSSEIGKRGVIDVLRKGLEHGALHFDLFFGTTSPGNEKAAALFANNRFTITRQLRYSMDAQRRALDLCLFINGLPIATFELKNSLTKQTAADAEEQYKRDRDPREKLFEFGRCVVHFAVDDVEVRMCSELRGRGSWFLPFNKGWNDGAGIRRIRRIEDGLFLEGSAHAQRPDEHPRKLRADRGGKHAKTGKKKRKQVFRVIINSTWCGRHWRTSRATARADGISSSIRPAAVSPIRSRGWRTNSLA